MELDMLVFTIHLASRLSMSCVKEQGVEFPESATCTSPRPGFPVWPFPSRITVLVTEGRPFGPSASTALAGRQRPPVQAGPPWKWTMRAGCNKGHLWLDARNRYVSSVGYVPYYVPVIQAFPKESFRTCERYRPRHRLYRYPCPALRRVYRALRLRRVDPFRDRRPTYPFRYLHKSDRYHLAL